MDDIGFTHIALPVSNLENTLGFYEKFAAMVPVHLRSSFSNPGKRVAWISDKRGPCVIVLLEVDEVTPTLSPPAHLGVACASRQELDQRCDLARSDGVLIKEPTDSGPPVGIWAFLRDPDGHTLELSFGQEVRLAVESSDR